MCDICNKWKPEMGKLLTLVQELRDKTPLSFTILFSSIERDEDGPECFNAYSSHPEEISTHFQLMLMVMEKAGFSKSITIPLDLDEEDNLKMN